MLANEIRNGIVSVGYQINRKLFLKLSVKNNVIEKEQFIVEGHKHTLLEIRQKILTKHSKFMRLNDDEYFDSSGKKLCNKD